MFLHELLPQGAERVMVAAGGTLGAAHSFGLGDVGTHIGWRRVLVRFDIGAGRLGGWRA